MVQDVAGRSRRRFRLGVGAVGAVSAVLGVVAAVGLGGWEITEHNGPESTLPAIESAPSPVKPTPPMPPEAMLNGSYRLTLEDSQSKYVRSTAADWSAGSVDYVGYIQFSTKCIGSECVATSSPTTDPTSPALGKTVETMVWTSGRWSSRQRPMPDGDGTDESSTILRSDGHRGFLGMTTDTIISGPHTGAQLSAPVVLTPTFDPANL
jgi:hypothetical protein